ncbi:GNAT family N-acetyltransferase [Peribacillus sp. SCS-37]|uniref:GNAT family N-acetyltransferase n=1 Tax=Paraperibacillus esterisolvens TaxID=3115296 RepID=UPI003906B118
MEIKRLVKEDAGIYKPLRLEALRNNPEAFGSSYEEEKGLPLEVTERRFSQENSFTFGAFEENRLIGSVSLVRETKRKFQHRASIFAMYVQKEYRRKGAGRKLMEAAIGKARSLEGLEQLLLTVVSSNAGAKNLYAGLGFTVYGEDKRALKLEAEYFDETLMVLYL